MSQKLINLSADLKKLQDEGYEIEIQNGFLLVRHIPYVNQKKEIAYGVLVSELTLAAGNKTTIPTTHVVYFQGEHPCDKEGKIIQAISHSSNVQKLFGEFSVHHSFSNKPTGGYKDYFEKITSYANIITAQAKSLDDTVTEKTFRPIIDSENESVFQYIDSNSSRANITAITEKLFNQKIGIIGLGGTGAYILDFVSKCPVSEIHLFDGDAFLQHNAFRSPGAAAIDTLASHMYKVDFYHQLYSKIHKNIISHNEYINDDTLDVLNSLNFIFISIDRGRIKKNIMEYLIDKNIPFIDVGIGVNKVDDSLIGMIRVTTVTKTKSDHLSQRVPISDEKDDEYNSNIQIAELNALNAALAVIKWKKLCGFYNDLEKEHNTIYSINVSQLINDEITN
jgi:tRNA A37 threonylcarbamoyladenosine dehydratase